MEFLTQYSARHRVALDTGPSMTKQSHQEECDINRIVNRYLDTGVMEHVVEAQATFADLEGVDFHSMMNMVVAAEEAFAAMAPQVRKRFDNDPGKLLAFLEDPGNRAEAISLGLVAKPVAASVEPGGTPGAPAGGGAGPTSP